MAGLPGFTTRENSKPPKIEKQKDHLTYTEADVSSSCTCNFLTRTFFLIAIACDFWRVLFFLSSVNVYASGTIILRGTESILILFNFDQFLSKSALFIHLPSSISKVA